LSELLQQIINGLSLGSIYALIALGYTMVYGILKLINFAHGEVFMVGAYAGYFSATWTPCAGERRLGAGRLRACASGWVRPSRGLGASLAHPRAEEPEAR
jgi:branched-subunit amino acid ABC-type transport system permease component